MRLKEWEVQTIRDTAAEVFGPDVRVYLFGSRTDDTVRGGDIDLYVESDRELGHETTLSARFQTRLKRRLGDQKIDVVVWDPTTKTARIHERAKETGVELTK
jgi:predicted nucleotidyltransferase